ncbi:hypothetical protein WICPIJ_009956 [Wickerhamomyces pijperi]|uniref:Uncharacterized protein n=1 Tax=Wickerhamomyces pijperi TaxID=599730 RepID=A0A9P8PKB8_WICPI|nr:hypothetical protein WICPIJ_009956 [Wickerhamomyces pijperi]
MTNHHGHSNILVPDTLTNLDHLLPELATLINPYQIDLAIVHYPVFYSYSLLSIISTLFIEPLQMTMFQLSLLVNNFFRYTTPSIMSSVGFADSWLPATKSLNKLPVSLSSDVLSVDQLLQRPVSNVKLAISAGSATGFQFPMLPEGYLITAETVSCWLITGIALTVIIMHSGLLFGGLREHLTSMLVPDCDCEIDSNVDSDYYIEDLISLGLSEGEVSGSESEDACDFTDDEEVQTRIDPGFILSLYKANIKLRSLRPGLMVKEVSHNVSSNETTAGLKTTVMRHSDLLDGVIGDNTAAEYVSKTEEDQDQDQDIDSDIGSIISDSVNIKTNEFKMASETEDTDYVSKSEDRSVNIPSNGANSWSLDGSIKASLRCGSTDNNHISSHNSFETASNTASWRFVNIDKEALSQRNNYGFVNRCNVTAGAEGGALLSLFEEAGKCD